MMSKKTDRKRKKTKQSSTVEKGKIVEQIVAAFHNQPGVKIETNVRLPGRSKGKKRREIDVLITAEPAGHAVQLAIECKNERKPIGTEKISSFIGTLELIGIPTKYGIFVSASGYTEDAIEWAEEAGIKTLTLVGLTKEGLSAVLLEAYQDVVFLMADIVQCSIEYEENTSDPSNPYVFFNSSGQFYGFLHDFVWELWIKNRIPDSVGEHALDLNIPPGMHQLIDGKLRPVKSISVKVRVTGLLITIPGKAEQYLLIDALKSEIDRGKVSVIFEDTGSPYPVQAIHSEEELKAFMARPGVVKVQSRVRLPRIRSESCYWPPSARVIDIVRERLGDHLKTGHT